MFLRALALVAAVALGSCSVAAARDPWLDLLELKDGTTYEGKIVEAVNGSFWLELPTGQLVSVPYQEVARVVRAAEPRADDLSLPDFDHRGEGRRVFRGGVDAGSTLGARMRWQFDTPAVHSFDARFGFGLFVASYPMPVFFHGLALNFLGDAEIHPQISLNFGLAFPSSLYPFVGAGGGIVWDPPSPFELHVGAIGGIAGSYLGFVPDIHAGFVW